ncbi:MAG: carboxypeptidase regulatory-like domain-containing protein [Bryobacteraceae bacterium]
MRKYLAVLLCALSVPAGYAQTGAAQIQGTVTDVTGAVIAGATVTVENTRTGGRFESSSNSAGTYQFPTLQAGDYKLTVTAAGLQKWEGQATLRAGQQAVINATLQVAQAAEQVTVVGNVTQLITTNSPTLATTVERARIEQLPLNGRSIQTLLTVTVPGLEGAVAQPRVYGLRDSAMEFSQDGVPLDDRNTGSIQARPPGLDTVQEFRVETNGSSAKLDRPANAIMITRAGTNEFHGAAFETGRNSGFGVARQRQDTFSKPPPLVRNEFGFSAGGPVALPKIYNGRNRTFIFGAWEELRLRQAASTGSAVWTSAMRQGDFSGLVDGNGRRYTLYDPWSVGAGPSYSKVPYVNNQLPITKLSPLAKYVFGVVPLPTDLGVNPFVANNYFGAAPTNSDQRTLTFRGDHRLGEKDQIYGRYSRGQWDQMNRRAFNTAGNPITSDNLWNRETYFERSNTEMISWTHTFSPTLFVETVATGSAINWLYSLNQQSALENISAKFGTPNPFNVNGAPYLLNVGYQSVQFHGIVPRSQYTQVISGEQNYTWVKDRHQLQFGGRYRQETLDTIPDRPDQSDLDFGSNATAIYNPATGNAYGTAPQTGDNAANFFLGIAGRYAQQRPPGPYNMKGKDLSLYVQDNWKVSPNLTLNLGVRWQYLGPYLDKAGVTSLFDFNSKSIVNPVPVSQLINSGYTTQPIVDGYSAIGVKWITPDKVGLPNNLVSVSKHDLAPRLGFAYSKQMGGRAWVVRGGYGLYRFPLPARTFNGMRGNAPLQGSYSFNWNDSANAPDGLPNYFLRNPPTVIAGVNTANLPELSIAKPPVILPGIAMIALDRNLPTSSAHQWNMTVEAEIAKNTVARAGMIGTNGRHTESVQRYNANPISNYVWYVNSGQALPTGFYQNTVRRAIDQTTFGDISIYSKLGWSNFTGVQLELERRYSDGLAFQLFYLMSNSASTGNVASQGGGFATYQNDQPEIFLPGAMPKDITERLRFYRYQRDPDIPKHRVRWNYLYDLPIGKGKRWASNANKFADRIIGGWQIAGYGTTASRYWSLPTNNWGPVENIQYYGTQYKISDCRQGTCFPGYLYWNGYIPANRVNVANGVTGLPQGYHPANTPINPIPANGVVANANFNDNNNVNVTLKNGATQLVAYDNGLHPWRNQVMPGPWLTNLTASVFKSIPIGERVNLRINIDAFNVLNQPGLNLPGGDGILSLRTSAQGARTMQYTARLTW